MRRALSKSHLLVFAADDGPFTRRHRRAPLVLVAVELPGRLEGVVVGTVEVDGGDATERLSELVSRSEHWTGARALLLDGITVGGFNVVDLDRLHRRIGLPIISVTRRAPDLASIRDALQTYFPRDFRRRWGRIVAHRLFAVATGTGLLRIAAVGCRRIDAQRLVLRTLVRGSWPDPLRIAWKISRAVGPGIAPRRRSARRSAESTDRLEKGDD